MPLYYLVDSFIRGKSMIQDIERYARTKKVVNLPTGSIDVPDMAMHSLMSDSNGNIIVVEPGNGFSVLSEKYTVMSNFSVLELPGDFFIGKTLTLRGKRYKIKVRMEKMLPE